MPRPNFVMIGGADPQRIPCAPTGSMSPGHHKHLCDCGACWGHANINQGETHAHTCPSCGNMVWQKLSMEAA